MTVEMGMEAIATRPNKAAAAVAVQGKLELMVAHRLLGLVVMVLQVL
jgi:hypothetical protein